MNDSTNIRIIADNIRKLNSRASNLEDAAARIPKDFSETETELGLKWIDERPIYRRVLSGTFDTSTSNFNQVFGAITEIVPVDISGFCLFGDGSAYQSIEHFTTGYTVASGNIYALSLPVNFSGGKYYLIIDYVKVPSTASKLPDEPEETTKKKTKRKDKSEISC